MVIDMNYWTKVFRKLVLLILSFITIYLSFKLASFYMPFLIAFVISLLLEPAIRFFMRKCKFRRKTSAIIVIVVVLGIILGLLTWGIATLVSEGSNLLDNFKRCTRMDYVDSNYWSVFGCNIFITVLYLYR